MTNDLLLLIDVMWSLFSAFFVSLTTLHSINHGGDLNLKIVNYHNWFNFCSWTFYFEAYNLKCCLKCLNKQYPGHTYTYEYQIKNRRVLLQEKKQHKYPEEIVSAPTTNTFKNRLDKYWSNQSLCMKTTKQLLPKVEISKIDDESNEEEPEGSCIGKPT
jgi:hypothetical protein